MSPELQNLIQTMRENLAQREAMDQVQGSQDVSWVEPVVLRMMPGIARELLNALDEVEEKTKEAAYVPGILQDYRRSGSWKMNLHEKIRDLRASTAQFFLPNEVSELLDLVAAHNKASSKEIDYLRGIMRGQELECRAREEQDKAYRIEADLLRAQLEVALVELKDIRSTTEWLGDSEPEDRRDEELFSAARIDLKRWEDRRGPGAVGNRVVTFEDMLIHHARAQGKREALAEPAPLPPLTPDDLAREWATYQTDRFDGDLPDQSREELFHHAYRQGYFAKPAPLQDGVVVVRREDRNIEHRCAELLEEYIRIGGGSEWLRDSRASVEAFRALRATKKESPDA